MKITKEQKAVASYYAKGLVLTIEYFFKMVMNMKIN